ncbi:MAG: hypothetical protein HY814_07610 [Candidatus Riflebacteria bacterium]|nr:hypothetical protein [Candidatus Riflebacteria bacterium]
MLRPKGAEGTVDLRLQIGRASQNWEFKDLEHHTLQVVRFLRVVDVQRTLTDGSQVSVWHTGMTPAGPFSGPISDADQGMRLVFSGPSLRTPDMPVAHVDTCLYRARMCANSPGFYTLV